jgi:hypothetical protein
MTSGQETTRVSADLLSSLVIIVTATLPKKMTLVSHLWINLYGLPLSGMAIRACWMEMSKADQAELEGWLRPQAKARSMATRARIVLGRCARPKYPGMAERVGATQPTVCLLRRRYQ